MQRALSPELALILLNKYRIKEPAILFHSISACRLLMICILAMLQLLRFYSMACFAIILAATYPATKPKIRINGIRII